MNTYAERKLDDGRLLFVLPLITGTVRLYVQNAHDTLEYDGQY